MLSLVLNACEFLDINVFFLTEQATKKSKKPTTKRYLCMLVFNVKRFILKLLKVGFSILTGKNTFLFDIAKNIA
jgi:hypothetical protein